MAEDSAMLQDGCCYSLSFLKTLNDFRQSGVLCDVVLQVQENTYKAHRVVLAASSVYFKSMFAGDLAEKNQDTVVIHDVEAVALEAIINYAYTSEIQVNESNVQCIMSCASMLQMAAIINRCAEFLSSRLHPSNCLGIQQYAALYRCTHLESKAKVYTQEHFREVSFCDEFLLLPLNNLVELVAADHLDVETEECVFSAIIRWVKFDAATRRASLAELLQHVRFQLLSPTFIQAQANLEPMLADFAIKCAVNIDAPKDQSPWLSLNTSARFSKTEAVIFALGGESTGYPLTSMQCFQPETNMWKNTLSVDESSEYQQSIACMETARTSFGAVADGKYIYAVGGTTSVQALDTVEVYCSINNTWNPLPSMAECRNGCKAALMNNTLYVTGGHNSFSYLNTVEALDLKQNSWRSRASMAVPRGFGCCGVIGGMLYCVGGTSGDANEDNIYHPEMERYDPHQNSWTKMAAMNEPRAYLAVVVLNNHLYAIGGFNGRWLNTVEKYNPKNNKWEYVRALSLPRSSFSATVHEGCIYVAGGFTGQKNVNTVERYDPCTDRWTPMCGMPMCRYGLQLVTADVPCRNK